MSDQRKGLIFNIQRFSLHDGPGIRTTVFLKGCPLKCLWCHNPEGIKGSKEIFYKYFNCILCGNCIESCHLNAITVEGNSIKIDRNVCDLCGECIKNCQNDALEICGTFMTVEEILEEVMADYEFYETSAGGLTISGGEPLMQYNFLENLLIEANKLKLHIALETTGYIETKKFTRILKLVDLVLFDVKSLDKARHERLTGVSNEVILKNLEKCLNHFPQTIIRIPIIYGYNFENIREELPNYILSIKNLGFTEFELIPYHKFGEQKYQMLELDYYIDIKSNQRTLIEEAISEIKKSEDINIKITNPILT